MTVLVFVRQPEASECVLQYQAANAFMAGVGAV
jgi:hypothetical protein